MKEERLSSPSFVSPSPASHNWFHTLEPDENKLNISKEDSSGIQATEHQEDVDQENKHQGDEKDEKQKNRHQEDENEASNLEDENQEEEYDQYIHIFRDFDGVPKSGKRSKKKI